MARAKDAPAETPAPDTVRVTAVCRVRLDDIEAGPGQQFDCSQAQAEELYALGAICAGFQVQDKG
jgi:hypothetical protein